MKIQAITTCSAAGWQAYGRRMAQTWAQYWPVPLTVWREGFEPDPSIEGVDWADLEAVAWLQEFKREHGHRTPRQPYNFRLDAARFAHKTAAVIESALAWDTDWLIWVDADTVTHAPVPGGFVTQLLPVGDEFIAWLDRVNNYPECGFYVLNLRHPRMVERLQTWRRWYVEGDLFHLHEWHDSYVLEHLVRAPGGLRTKSLSGERARRTSHPFVNGPLGAYMDHLKGPRKTEGKSRRGDLKVHRTETYWRNVR